MKYKEDIVEKDNKKLKRITVLRLGKNKDYQNTMPLYYYIKGLIYLNNIWVLFEYG